MNNYTNDRNFEMPAHRNEQISNNRFQNRRNSYGSYSQRNTQYNDEQHNFYKEARFNELSPWGERRKNERQSRFGYSSSRGACARALDLCAAQREPSESYRNQPRDITYSNAEFEKPHTQNTEPPSYRAMDRSNNMQAGRNYICALKVSKRKQRGSKNNKRVKRAALLRKVSKKSSKSRWYGW